MIYKKEIKYLASLKQKKFRLLNHEFVIEGSKLIIDALEHKQPIKKIIYSTKGENFNKIRRLSKKSNIELALCTPKDAERISDTQNSQQIFALLQYEPLMKIDATKNTINNDIIVLDGVADPGNMGTILRTCSWFGYYNIIITNDSVELYNPKTVRSAMGAHFHMEHIYQDNINNIIEYLKKCQYQILATDLKGTNIKKYELTNNKWALILGNEAKGLSKVSKENAQLIHIKGEGKMESLNVAEAASIVIHYLYKK